MITAIRTNTNRSGRTITRTNATKEYQVKALVSTEDLQSWNWKHVKVIFHPTEEIKGYAVFDTANETVIATGTKWQCDNFLRDWSGALGAIERNLEKAEEEFLVGNHVSKGTHLQLAIQAARKIGMNISDRTDPLRGTGVGSCLSSSRGLGTLIISC